MIFCWFIDVKIILNEYEGVVYEDERYVCLALNDCVGVVSVNLSEYAQLKKHGKGCNHFKNYARLVQNFIQSKKSVQNTKGVY